MAFLASVTKKKVIYIYISVRCITKFKHTNHSSAMTSHGRELNGPTHTDTKQ